MKPKKTLKDLRPNATIECFSCRTIKPQATAVKFHAHHVCAECAARLKNESKKPPIDFYKASKELIERVQRALQNQNPTPA